jgi:hypothetical protein
MIEHRNALVRTGMLKYYLKTLDSVGGEVIGGPRTSIGPYPSGIIMWRISVSYKTFDACNRHQRLIRARERKMDREAKKRRWEARWFVKLWRIIQEQFN